MAAPDNKTLTDTANAFITALSSLNIESMLALRTPDCLQHIYPASLGRNPMSNAEFAAAYGAYLPNFSNYSITVHSMTVDIAQHKVVLHANGEAVTIAGPFQSEYIFTLHMSEDGSKVRKVEEFVDSALSKEQGGRIREAIANAKEAENGG